MNGLPVWLASVSRWKSAIIKRGQPQPVPTYEWNDGIMMMATQKLMAAVDGVGDPDKQRIFRMNLTLCLHRAASESEIKTQAAKFITEPKGCCLAGGPVEVMWETVEGRASTKPCHNPRRQYISSRIWVPMDCGRCEPCQARSILEMNCSETT